MSHYHKPLLVVEEVNLHDLLFIIWNDALNFGNILDLVEVVAGSEFFYSCFAELTIRKR